MRLIHYSDHEIKKVRAKPQKRAPYDMKPEGLWVSDNDCADNWPAWCIAEGFGLHKLTHIHTVEVTEEARILVLASKENLDRFTRDFSRPESRFPVRHNIFLIDWNRVREQHDGLIITPYIWARRHELLWYYSWDCASGCLWNPDVVRIQLWEVVEAPVKESLEK